MSRSTLCAALCPLLAAVCLPAGPASAQETQADLAKKLANPVASLISVPLQNNYDCCYGPSDGYRYTLNVQPVVPVSVGEDWNMIVRTIVPLVYQDSTAPGVDSASGFSDVNQTFFFSPKDVKNGFVWAVGPVFIWPVGSSELGSEKWSAGPSALLLKQSGPTTVGVLANHVWSYAGDSSRSEVSNTYVQPFFSYTYPTSTAISLSSETSYNWIDKKWTVPIIGGVTHVYKFGGQLVQLGGFAKVYAASPGRGPDWGMRFNVVFLFPKK